MPTAAKRRARMLELWIPITVAAAILQCLRTAWQKRLTRWLSTNGANFVRYLYGAPIAILLLLVVVQTSGAVLPTITPRYLLLCVVGGVAQIVATSLLIIAFTLRNFAAGTTYSKTETIQVALLSTVLLAEPIGFVAWIAIVVSLFGVMILSLPAGQAAWRDLLLGWTEKAALIGIGSGAMFGVAAVSIRAASLSLESGDFLLRAVLTLACINTMQTAIMGAYLVWREPRQLREVLSLWRPAALVGLMSVLGSAGWFMAMTLQNAAYVRALGQVELVFTLLVSRFAFREPPTLRELAGMALIAGGVVALLTGR